MADESGTEMEAELFPNRVPKTDKERQELFSIYALAVEMADRVSARRQTANSFYVSVCTFLVGVIYGASSVDVVNKWTLFALSISGFAVTLMWSRSVRSYGDLNSGKFKVINEMERFLVASPYTAEWSILDRGKNSKKYRKFQSIEKYIPVIFSVLFVIMAIALTVNPIIISLNRSSDSICI